MAIFHTETSNKRFIIQLHFFQPFAVTWKKTTSVTGWVRAVLYNNQLYNIVGYLYSFHVLSVQ